MICKVFTYVVNELMETDLACIVKSPQPLSDEHCQFFIYQILRGMKYVHSAGILHRDLKPRNLLVNSNCDLKICDFGLARADLPDLKFHSTVMTDYIATRWYRAPEVLLSWKRYNKAIDVWSIGCILAELLGRRPLFPGTETDNQLEIIIDMMGTPSEEEISSVPVAQKREMLKNMPKKKPKSFETMFKSANPLAVDLLKKLLIFDPLKRITVDEALAHPYLKDLHFPEDEPIAEPVSLFDFEFEKYELGKEELKDLIYEEILLYHFPEKREEYIKLKRMYPNGILSMKYESDKKKNSSTVKRKSIPK